MVGEVRMYSKITSIPDLYVTRVERVKKVYEKFLRRQREE